MATIDRSTADVAAPGTVLVMGAGAVGCYLGGSLRAAGVPVVLVGRARVLDPLREHGLRITDLDGGDRTLDPAELVMTPTLPPRAAVQAALVLLCVKSAATADAAASLASALAPGTLVVSMQNGISNADTARLAAPQLRVVAGMVGFNVVQLGGGRFHRATTGALAAEDDPALRRWTDAFAAAGLPLELHAKLRAIQWAKLLLNLNNPVNALSGLPLKSELSERRFRICLAALQRETLRVLRVAQIEPARLTPLPPSWIPAVLRLPTPLFRIAAARMLRIDAQARSSMADDFGHGRPTEIDALCGEVVRLAQAHGTDAPLNAAMVRLVEGWPLAPKTYTGAELERALGLR